MNLPAGEAERQRITKCGVAPSAEMVWQIAPRRARAKFSDNSVNEKPVAKIAVATDCAGATWK